MTIRSEMRLDYGLLDKNRMPTTRRVHFFPQADGSEIACHPRFCRECAREKNA